MGIFGQATPFDADIEKATSETNTNENWTLILDVCDKVSSNPRNAKDCLKAIMKRMGHQDPHVVMQAITLLDACCNNCGKSFHLEIASREFETEYRRLLSKAHSKVSLKMRQVIKSWAENDFKTDPELNLIPSLYNKLRLEGYDFSNINEKQPKSAAKFAASKDPNVVSSQQEEEDIAKAIELSLKESKNSPKNQSGSASVGGSVSGNAGGTVVGGSSTTAYPQLYPTFSGSGSGSLGSVTSAGVASNASSQPEPRKVRALYDFEAAEENELTFVAGEIIHVLDDTDPNWWKGFNQRGDGLFPSNFVTADLSVDPERLDINQQNKSKKTVQFEDDARELELKTEAAAAAAANQRIEIDEAKIDRLLHLLHEANPEDPSQDSDEMLRLEQEVHQMGPLIDAELERVDRKHAQLTQLSSDLVDAINLYHSLMRDDRAGLIGNFMAGMPHNMGGGYQTTAGVASNPQMLYGAAAAAAAASNVYPTTVNHQQHQQLPQNYGMSSLPAYGGNMVGHQLPATTTTGAALPPPSSATSTAQGINFAPQIGGAVQPSSMGVPIQYQNGHVNTPQMNNGLNNLAHQMSAAVGQQQTQPQHLYGTPHQQQSVLPVGQSGQPPQQNQNYQILPPPPQQQQQQQQQHQELPPPSQQQQQQQYNTTQSTNAIGNTSTTMPPQTLANNVQQQPHYMSPHHQQQQQPQMTPFMLHQMLPQPPQQQQQQSYANLPNGAQTYVPANLMQQQQQPNINNHNNNNNNNNPDHLSQLQQQMAAMSMGLNQPVTQSFLVQNEPKNSIPIYQQQR